MKRVAKILTPLPPPPESGRGFSPRGLEVHTLATSDDEYLLVSYDLPTAVAPAGLTRAEEDVALAVSSGLTNGEIAEQRGTSQRTVANQLRSIFAKLGLSSRAELVLLSMRAPGAQNGQ
ncbi:MAG TPA: helix-turn-helix transcriptional regulator [Polyangiaceae bacterium]|nr:helix-turn-helix transcriptional regulator [Polyangiaceae bacterium]